MIFQSGDQHDEKLVENQNPAYFDGDMTEGINGQQTVRFDSVNDAKSSVLRVPEVDIRTSRHSNVMTFSLYRPRRVAPNNAKWDRFYRSFHPGFGYGKSDGISSFWARVNGA